MNNIRLHVLNANGRFSSHRDKLKEIVKKAVGKITKKISVKNVDIVLFDPRDEQSGTLVMAGEMRMGGICYGPSLVMIPINGLKLFNDSEKEELEATLAHELFHTARWQAVGSSTDLKEALVNEGIAGHFEEEIIGSVRGRYYHSLNSVEHTKLRNRARLEYGSIKKIYEKWFLGKDTDIPLWTGYTLGYELVQTYLERHPGIKASDLIKKRASEIV